MKSSNISIIPEETILNNETTNTEVNGTTVPSSWHGTPPQSNNDEINSSTVPTTWDETPPLPNGDEVNGTTVPASWDGTPPPSSNEDVNGKPLPSDYAEVTASDATEIYSTTTPDSEKQTNMTK